MTHLLYQSHSTAVPATPYNTWNLHLGLPSEQCQNLITTTNYKLIPKSVANKKKKAETIAMGCLTLLKSEKLHLRASFVRLIGKTCASMMLQ